MCLCGHERTIHDSTQRLVESLRPTPSFYLTTFSLRAHTLKPWAGTTSRSCQRKATSPKQRKMTGKMQRTVFYLPKHNCAEPLWKLRLEVAMIVFIYIFSIIAAVWSPMAHHGLMSLDCQSEWCARHDRTHSTTSRRP